MATKEKIHLSMKSKEVLLERKFYNIPFLLPGMICRKQVERLHIFFCLAKFILSYVFALDIGVLVIY